MGGKQGDSNFPNQAWALLALGLVQLVATLLFQTLVPFLYLALFLSQDIEVRQGFEQLSSVGQNESLSEEELFGERRKLLRPLLAKVPWSSFVFLSSVLLFFPLGFLARRYLRSPESAGFLILLSVSVGQNPVLTPLTLQSSGFGSLAIPLWEALVMIAIQFVALSAGILSKADISTKGDQGKQTNPSRE